ncbi:uncharacterized protein BCR38DRAFT_42971 [Pseudomassariella vexata]|uniref:Uncharacterized protein n=1 Tax=Pseudomassariella vexata TaxID=1141098 RepID=A0A1Y2DMZ6_9PEZI|nr:uncharacterized protein BCR38DRAFT_42971 [Pseudomassariella vexata]ORY60617.1 hypothetical protein BCR38DRAFT_42971 [Pseudomassariella vexata]
MSQYNYMYSPYPGQQSQQSFQYASASVQAPGLQESSSVAAPNNLAMTNASFEYNGNRIPGLGMSVGSGTSAFPSSSYGGDNGVSWRPPMSGGTPSMVLSTLDQDLGKRGGHSHQEPHASPRSSNFGIQAQASQADEDALEGELSEGGFEDLYEPRGPDEVETTGNKTHQAFQPSTAAEDQSGSTGDADGSSIYDTGSTREEVLVGSTSGSLPAVEEEEYSPGEYYEPAYQGRERSGSYSPYLSPREIHKEASVLRISPREAKKFAPLPESSHSFADPATLIRQRPDSAALPNGGGSLGHNTTQAMNPNNIQAASDAASPYKSVWEARKKAQEAILGLWPFKVRYQDYIEEGFDASLVKPLFTGLGLDTSSSKANSSSLPQRTSDIDVPSAPVSHISSPAKSIQPAPKSTPPPKSQQHPAKSPAPSQLPQASAPRPDSKSNAKMADKTGTEDRKTKIARLLAEKEKKQKTTTAAVVPPVSDATAALPQSVPSTKAPEPAQPLLNQAKAKTRAEKNLMLQQKIAALRKAQEAEAKKKLELIKQTEVTAVSAVPQHPAKTATATPPVQQSDMNAPPEQRDAVFKAAGIPGLFLSSTPQPLSANRIPKRPVASDFDAYPSHSGSLKRSRTQDSLIIEVSDEEDVEMDMGSPTDVPESAIHNGTSSTRPDSNSLGAFPPLTNTNTWVQRSSPMSSAVHTPPDHANKLDFLHKQIEEHKRKIAEAEAKKAGKKSNGATTPLPQTPSESGSTRLPKVSDMAARIAKHERRDRIASYELPNVETALREKQEKLRRLQSEAAQLELEVKAEMAERERLAAEMEDIGDNIQAESNDSDGQTHSNSGKSSEPATRIARTICGGR